MKQKFAIAGIALAATLSAGASSAFAADLGGNCCADLEERIAELEATTARKGNRKVSLTVSGWVNEALFAWDDGTDRDVYIGTNFIEQSRVRFLGDAKINSDVSAGYLLEFGLTGNPSNQWNQNSPNSSSANPANSNSAVFVRKSLWYLKSKQYGQVSVGQNGTATYHLLDDADPTLTRNVDDAEGAAIFMSQFQLRANGASIGGGGGSPLRWTDVLRGFNNSTPGDSGRRNVVRYDSPVWQGFSVAGAWGEDDIWDTALTYKNDIGDFSVLAKVGYGESTDPGANNVNPTYVQGGTTCISGTSNASSVPGFECSWGGAGATLMHKPTGLFLYGGWGKQHIETDNVTTANRLIDPDSTVWFLQPGIEHKWLDLGKTNIFGEYRRDDAGSNPGRTVGAQIDFWQAGIIQNIEAADMSMYLLYQHAEGDITGNAQTATGNNGAAVGKTELDDFDMVVAGAKINF